MNKLLKIGDNIAMLDTDSQSWVELVLYGYNGSVDISPYPSYTTRKYSLEQIDQFTDLKLMIQSVIDHMVEHNKKEDATSDSESPSY